MSRPVHMFDFDWGGGTATSQTPPPLGMGAPIPLSHYTLEASILAPLALDLPPKPILDRPRAEGRLN